MASTSYPMIRYSIKALPADLWEAIVACAVKFHDGGHGVPTICHVNPEMKNFPPQIGVLRVIAAWGPGPHEIDLGIAPEA
jgi:hypothetical protein